MRFQRFLGGFVIDCGSPRGWRGRFSWPELGQESGGPRVFFSSVLFLNNDPHNDYNGWTPWARRVKREKRVNLRNVA
jgi:hypothetical protein